MSIKNVHYILAPRMATDSTFIGSLSTFDPDQESISFCMERIQIFFTASSVEEDKQVAVFLSMFGANNAYTLLCTLLTLAKLCTTQGHYSWSQGMGILGDKVQESQEFVTLLPTSHLFICKRGNASLHSAPQKCVYLANQTCTSSQS